MRRRENSLRDLDEINRALFVFDQYKLANLAEDDLLKYMTQSPVVSQTVLDHKSTLDFCVLSNILQRAKNVVSLTHFGRHLLNLAKVKNPRYMIDINERQKDFVNTKIFLDPSFISPIQGVLRDYFESDDTRRTWSYNYTENPELPSDFMDWVGILKQSELLSEHDGVLEVNPMYSSFVSILFARRPGKISAEDLDETLEEQKEIGRVAEEIVVEYERKELRKAKCFDEAELVSRISDWDVAAGYDIKSFNGPSRTMKHDKFIEVKGSAGGEVRFFWSANEIEKASVLRNSYWLYFLSRVSGRKHGTPLKIRDPYRRILNSKDYNTKCVKFLVTSRKAS